MPLLMELGDIIKKYSTKISHLTALGEASVL
jgi:hypothetical protein